MNDDELTKLDELDLQKEIEAPSHMKQRWHDSIELAAQREYASQRKAPKPFNPMSFFWGAAITTALAVGIGIGVMLSDGPASIDSNNYAVQETTLNGPDRSAVFSRVLQAHFRDTQESIASMPASSVEDQTMLIMQIIQQNRLFEQAAGRNHSENLARVLRAFEPILLQLAATDIAPEDADALREQLAFQLKIMLTKLEHDTSKDTQST